MDASSGSDAYEGLSSKGRAVTSALATCAKEVLSRQGLASVRNQMDNVYRTLRLRDDQGDWATPQIATMGEDLLPSRLTLDDINSFIDDIKRVSDLNTYLMNFAAALPDRGLAALTRRLQQSETTVVPEIIGFAMALQNLTASFHDNIEWVTEVVNHWEREAQLSGSHSQQGLLFRLKHASVYSPIRKSHQIVRLGKVPGNFCNFHLPFNILQAVGYDFLKGKRANAAAGSVLARHYPGNNVDPATGAGPVHLSLAGSMLETGFPLAEKWADLYQSWNLAFGAQFDSFPFYLCKLIIPQVAGYHDAPQRYIWNRTNALMTYLYFSGFAAYDKRQEDNQDSLFYRTEWPAFSKGDFCRLWGEVNKNSAADYKKNLRNATAT